MILASLSSVQKLTAWKGQILEDPHSIQWWHFWSFQVIFTWNEGESWYDFKVTNTPFEAMFVFNWWTSPTAKFEASATHQDDSRWLKMPSSQSDICFLKALCIKHQVKLSFVGEKWCTGNLINTCWTLRYRIFRSFEISKPSTNKGESEAHCHLISSLKWTSIFSGFPFVNQHSLSEQIWHPLISKSKDYQFPG